MAKRSATSELNRDNCEQEDPPEEPGIFQHASEEALKNRVIRTARRRCTASSTQDSPGVKSLFAGFTGFTQKKDNTETAKPSFSFLSASPTTAAACGSNGTGERSKDTNTSTPVNGTETPSKQMKDKEYFSKLKGLNESVARWISSHVAKNPLCKLTPVFRDYEKHLQSIENARQKETSETTTDIEEVTTKSDDTKTALDKDTVKFSSVNPITRKDDTAGPESEETLKSPFSQSSPATTFGKILNSPSPSIFSPPSQPSKPVEKSGVSGSIFGSAPSASPAPTATMSFGMSSSTSPPSAGFFFGASNVKPFTFSNVSKPETTESADNEDEAEEPPKPDHKPVGEEGAVYEKRCKVYVKKNGQFADRGVGSLFLKPVCNGEKTQLIVRADTSLGNILLNVLLSSALPTTRLGNKDVAIVCVPTPDEKPPPTTVLLRVKTAEDADELLASLEKHKK